MVAAIVRDALRGIKRFGEFQKSLGIAKHADHATEAAGRRRHSYASARVRRQRPQEYVLTDKGRALQTVLVALSQWGNEFLFAENECGTVLVDSEQRKPLRRLALIADDGRELTPEEIVAKLPPDRSRRQKHKMPTKMVAL